MKQLILKLILVTLSAPVCFGEWTAVAKGVDGYIVYVDFERIREHGGYVYWWELTDRLKPNEFWKISCKIDNQADCNFFCTKRLSLSFYRGSMGEGNASSNIDEPMENWDYPKTIVINHL